MLMSGEQMIGKITARDKFTITIKIKDPTEETVTIYKHAIEYFGEATNPNGDSE